MKSRVVSLIPFLLVSDLLLLNRYPDVEADKEVGRNHLPITIGIKRSHMKRVIVPIRIGNMRQEGDVGHHWGNSCATLKKSKPHPSSFSATPVAKPCPSGQQQQRQ